MTPKEFYYNVDAHNEKLIIQDSLNHMLGRYIGYAVNDPKKYPKEPFLEEDKSDGTPTYNLNEMDSGEIDKAMENMANKFNARVDNGKD